MQLSNQAVIDHTRTWLERAVIGLNLCPFAKSVHVKGLVHYVVSAANSPQELLDDLKAELVALSEVDCSVRDTTLLIAPYCLPDFLDFNEFLGDADQALHELRLVGVMQIADMHPAYQFAGTSADDITNFTNRAPYPTLHLLREESIDRAVTSFPDAEAIYEKNIETLRHLGHDGWTALAIGART